MEGLWTVEFITNIGGTGSGTVIFENGRIAGGDAGYYYIGTYSIENDRLTGKIKTQRYKDGHTSVFGPLEQGTIKISGKIQGSDITASGSLLSHPDLEITIRGTKRESF